MSRFFLVLVSESIESDIFETGERLRVEGEYYKATGSYLEITEDDFNYLRELRRNQMDFSF